MTAAPQASEQEVGGTSPATHTLWTPEQLAEFLGINTDELSKMRSEGTGPAFFKFRRKIRYNPRHVAEWLETLTRTSTKEETNVR